MGRAHSDQVIALKEGGKENLAMRAGADRERHPGATASRRLMAKKGKCACHTFHTSLSVHANLKDVGKPDPQREEGRKELQALDKVCSGCCGRAFEGRVGDEWRRQRGRGMRLRVSAGRLLRTLYSSRLYTLAQELTLSDIAEVELAERGLCIARRWSSQCAFSVRPRTSWLEERGGPGELLAAGRL